MNCYGSRVLTSGLDLGQYQRNPLLLWMHRRCWEGGNTMPIGRVENLRLDGDRLIGTPVFDLDDPFAAQIASKWENDFLRMASAGIEIMATSTAPEDMLPGQTRATVTRSKLMEVSIVDIGANDDALRLNYGGKLLALAAGEPNEILPLVEAQKEEDNAGGSAPADDNPKTNNTMNEETLKLLGLDKDAGEQAVHEAVRQLKLSADRAQSLELAALTAAVDAAVADKRITEGKRDHFLQLGRKVGVEALRETLALMQPARKPTDVVRPGNEEVPGGGQPQTFAKLSEVPEGEVEKLKQDNPKEYARLYKAEYGMELPN